MNITSFKVSDDKSVLELDISDASAATYLYLWTKKTYKLDDLKIDLSSKLTGSATQSITITPEELEVPHFDGVYFIELGDGTDDVCSIAYEFTRYKECILDKVLEYTECNNCLENTNPETLNSFSLLYTLEKAIELNLIQEVLTLVFALDKFCSNDCKGCGEYKNI